MIILDNINSVIIYEQGNIKTYVSIIIIGEKRIIINKKEILMKTQNDDALNEISNYLKTIKNKNGGYFTIVEM